ncbi:Peptidase M20 domain-containing protein [Fusarium oxysporum f. sp. albedinis]|nr:Peptidase M20 domain-containing protein [Fusarium oxysporum f. sp. albedinis]
MSFMCRHHRGLISEPRGPPASSYRSQKTINWRLGREVEELSILSMSNESLYSSYLIVKTAQTANAGGVVASTCHLLRLVMLPGSASLYLLNRIRICSSTKPFASSV